MSDPNCLAVILRNYARSANSEEAINLCDAADLLASQEAAHAQLVKERNEARQAAIDADIGRAELYADLSTIRSQLQGLRDEMLVIARVAGQCSVEGPPSTKSLMAAAEAARASKWADQLDQILDLGR